MSSTITVAPATARSSLEEMLESLKRRDEKPKDALPVLPVRPTLRGRLPSSRQSLPFNFKIESTASGFPLKELEKPNEERASRGEKDMVFENGVFSRKRVVKVDQLEEAPNVKMTELECDEERAGNVDVSDSIAALSSTACRIDDSIDYVSNKDSVNGVQASVIAELQRQIQNAETALRQKEGENDTLQQQLQQYETRLSDYEAKMKSKEEVWRKEVASLQTSLAAAKKSPDDASPIRRDQGSESAISAIACGTKSTLPGQTCGSDAGVATDSDGTRNPVRHLVNEFEQQTKVFEDDAHCVIKVKSGQSGSSVNPIEELRKLKDRFAAWKKDYKTRLHNAKAEIDKVTNSEGQKTRRIWWGKRCRK